MIKTENLLKTFATKSGPVTAVDRLTLQVDEGEVFGFLGPNGAGKTTTVRLLTALIAPTGGQAWVNKHQVGQEDTAIRQSAGILTENPGLYEQLSAEKNLTIYARLYGVADVTGQVERYLRLLGLWERRRETAGGFSKGMKQKLAICRALLHEPRVLFLDEPTAALDPEAARTVRDFIRDLKAHGRTTFLCTHNLDEAEDLCDRIGVINHGRLIALDTPANLRRQLFGQQTVVELAAIGDAALDAVRALPFVENLQVDGSRLTVALGDPEAQNPTLVRALVQAGAEVQYVRELEHSLEEVYFSLMGQD
ncbi:MAG: ABC transporter ATP-binding protein [Anaerolineae bacterium]|nr:ABC transporter ATP-binding protein [Anaerolineae bacterium]